MSKTSNKQRYTQLMEWLGKKATSSVNKSKFSKSNHFKTKGA